MACHVFGTSVTDATFKGMTEYNHKAIQAVDRARVALEMKNAEGKDIEARNFVDKIQTAIERKGVRCVIYNATGGPLKLVANGQWASFVHEKVNAASITALVFEATQDNPTR
ncbi:23 kDa jasmonate-induced protein-like [Silene latifolia]|uniref:23 kDa jasmonate-induced protein-like n=1 Tax=Silene latifolia TaxID=37657 RepID=UPI003D77678B